MKVDRPHMTDASSHNPPTIEAIGDDFAMLDDWEDRYRYVIELGRQVPPLAHEDKTEVHKVRGCASQVWLTSTLAPASPPTLGRLRFAGESDSHIVQGLIAILLALTHGKTVGELLALDLQAQFAKLGLQDHLTPQRSNGLAAMVARIRADAVAAAKG
jgi:cysteine desulfuration protein SufE